MIVPEIVILRVKMVVRIRYRPNASESTRLFRTQRTLLPVRVLALAAITFLYLGGQHPKNPRLHAAGLAIKKNPALTIRRGPADLSLHWDRESAEIRDGDSGQLAIRDGAMERTVFLSTEQLRYGSVFYPDATDRMTFRLFLTRRGSPVCELSVLAREATPVRTTVE